MINCILTGVGGQGTVLASKLIAQSAMDNNRCVRTAETIGMAQRGGCVVSHVRFGETPDEAIASPLIPLGEAHLILAFEPGEALRCLEFLRPGGVMVVAEKAVKPVTATLSGSTYDGTEALDYLRAHVDNLTVVDGETICAECGSPKVLNVVLLGAATETGVLGVSIADMERVLTEKLPERFIEMNTKALHAGAAVTKDIRWRP